MYEAAGVGKALEKATPTGEELVLFLRASRGKVEDEAMEVVEEVIPLQGGDMVTRRTTWLEALREIDAGHCAHCQWYDGQLPEGARWGEDWPGTTPGGVKRGRLEPGEAGPPWPPGLCRPKVGHQGTEVVREVRPGGVGYVAGDVEEQGPGTEWRILCAREAHGQVMHISRVSPGQRRDKEQVGPIVQGIQQPGWGRPATRMSMPQEMNMAAFRCCRRQCQEPGHLIVDPEAEEGKPGSAGNLLGCFHPQVWVVRKRCWAGDLIADWSTEEGRAAALPCPRLPGGAMGTWATQCQTEARHFVKAVKEAGHPPMKVELDGTEPVPSIVVGGRGRGRVPSEAQAIPMVTGPGGPVRGCASAKDFRDELERAKYWGTNLGEHLVDRRALSHDLAKGVDLELEEVWPEHRLGCDYVKVCEECWWRNELAMKAWMGRMAPWRTFD